MSSSLSQYVPMQSGRLSLNRAVAAAIASPKLMQVAHRSSFFHYRT